MRANLLNCDYFYFKPENFSDTEFYSAVYERFVTLWKISKFMTFKLPTTMDDIAKPYKRSLFTRSVKNYPVRSITQ